MGVSSCCLKIDLKILGHAFMAGKVCWAFERCTCVCRRGRRSLGYFVPRSEAGIEICLEGRV